MDKLSPPASSQRLPTSSHRLPTISASEALQSLRADGPKTVSTGLDQLDNILASSTHNQNGTSTTSSHGGGLERGKITEIWGPPGSGKTSLAMQAAAQARQAGGSVAWVDTGSPLVKQRFEKVFALADGLKDGEPVTTQFESYCAPTVAHLLALVMHSPTSFPPPNTSLMVIDGLNSIFEVSYPRQGFSGYSNKTDAAKWAAGRRYSVLGSLIAALRKLAALHNMAVIVTTGCATRVRSGSGLGAVLVPGLSGAEWENGVTNRLVTFRDFASVKTDLSQKQNGDVTLSARYIGIQKVKGVAFGEDGDIGHLVAFRIDKTGVRQVDDPSAQTDATPIAIAVSSPIKGRKRRHDEVADSDADDAGSEYGWLDEDAEGLIDAAALNEEHSGVVEVEPVND